MCCEECCTHTDRESDQIEKIDKAIEAFLADNFFSWFEKEKLKHSTSNSLLTEVMKWIARESNVNYNNIYVENMDKK